MLNFLQPEQAYRTSPEVYLIFGANKQGSFSGYGIMRSGIPAVTRKPSSSSAGGETSFSSQGSRTTQLKSATDTSTRHGGLLSPRGEDIQEETGYVAEPTTRSHRLGSVESTAAGLAMLSPGEMTPGEDFKSPPPGSPLSYGWTQTAPQPERQFSASEGPHPRAMTFDTKALARLRAEEALKRQLASKAETNIQDFELDKNAALDAQRDRKENDSDDLKNVVRKDMVAEDEKDAPAAAQAVSDRHIAADASVESSSPEHKRASNSKDNGGLANDQLSHTFKVEWLQVGELPFSSIKSLRNPWNQDKEVKVSRDGTELEPGMFIAKP